MSSRRAAIRREHKERKKILEDKSPKGRERRIRLKGQNDGRTIAYYTVLYLLLKEYGFNNKKIEKMCRHIAEESIKFSQEGEQFVVIHYGKKIAEIVNKSGYQLLFRDLEDAWYQTERDDYYFSTCSIMVIVLKDNFGFGTNKAGNGRLDKVMQFCAEEYLKIQQEMPMRTPEWYQKRAMKVVEDKGWEQKFL